MLGSQIFVALILSFFLCVFGSLALIVLLSGIFGFDAWEGLSTLFAAAKDLFFFAYISLSIFLFVIFAI